MGIAPQPLGMLETSYGEDDEALDGLVVLAATGLEREVLVMRCPEETRERPRFTPFMDGGSRSSSRLLLTVADLLPGPLSSSKAICSQVSVSTSSIQRSPR
ncbi:hypothetical protein BE04_17605 [Sorangium cellulosum]|uniref:Uncharacterized protein n=2 Tax=Sorangium cellulosum TaxID=56 RepID=A0A150PC46_SORCE|nr:hypothetical protein SCE1572_26960 [Sorangium cellulosum So0157-2]KYF53058.1 hypothetical protein BE04_17605 [Sorangium cellulosum]